MNDNSKQGAFSVVRLDRFKDTVLFSITLRRFGNSVRIKDMAALKSYFEAWEQDSTPADETSAAPPMAMGNDRVRSNKTLLKSPRFDKLNKAMNALKSNVESMSIPSYFKAGMLVSKQSNVGAIETMLKDGWRKIEERELNDFLRGYDEDILAAQTTPVKKGGLGPLFRREDYPTADDIRKMFAIEWYWMALSVPENIPDELKAEANEKFKRRMEDAAEQIEQALREELLDLVAHAEDRLTAQPGEKPKVFRESMIGNIVQFINTFDARDVFSDEKMKPILEQVKAVLLDENGKVKASPQKLRDYKSVREDTRAAFADIRSKLDALIEEKGRRVDLSD